MASGGHNRKTARELAAAASRETANLLSTNSAGRDHLLALLDAWVAVANMAVSEIDSETSVTVVNAGDQLQKHPAVTVLEAASKRVEALVVMVDRFADGADPADETGDELPEQWKPTVA